jgi:hypothetical protein
VAGADGPRDGAAVTEAAVRRQGPPPPAEYGRPTEC